MKGRGGRSSHAPPACFSPVLLASSFEPLPRLQALEEAPSELTSCSMTPVHGQPQLLPSSHGQAALSLQPLSLLGVGAQETAWGPPGLSKSDSLTAAARAANMATYALNIAV